MDIGKFKASRTRLTLWLLIPPLLIVGIGLSTYALQLQSEWELIRTRQLSDVLPRLVMAQERAGALMDDFYAGESQSIKSEDGLISFMQEAAAKVDFTVDSLKVDRKTVHELQVLSASVSGSGGLVAINRFLADVSSSQQLLFESSLQMSHKTSEFEEDLYRADITFDLVLFNEPMGGR